MPRTADSIRLEVPLKNSQKLMQLQWKHPLPLNVAFWEDCGWRARAAWCYAFYHWEKAVKHGLFKLVDIDSGNVHVACGEQAYENVLDSLDIFSMPIPGTTFSGHETGGQLSCDEDAFGECAHTWDASGKVLACSVALDSELSLVDAESIALHEVGHALLLGHDPDTPMRVMYRKHTGARRPKPIEAAWVREIWGI